MLRVPSEQDTMNIDKTLVDETITSLLFVWGLPCVGLKSRTYETKSILLRITFTLEVFLLLKYKKNTSFTLLALSLQLSPIELIACCSFGAVAKHYVSNFLEDFYRFEEKGTYRQRELNVVTNVAKQYNIFLNSLLVHYSHFLFNKSNKD